MRESKFIEPQIVGILKEADSGLPVGYLLRKHGVSQRRPSSGAARTPARRWPT